MKKNLSKGIAIAVLIGLLLGTAIAGFLALADQMGEVEFESDFED